MGATREENGSEFAGCKKPPVTVTRVRRRVFAPIGGERMRRPRRGRSARELVRESGKATKS